MALDTSRKIIPRLNYITFYKPNTFLKANRPKVLDNGSWAIEGDLHIYDQRARDYNHKLPFYKKKIMNRDGDIGHIFPILVCSKNYIKINNVEIAVGTLKPIVFDTFDRIKIEEYFSKKIQGFGELTIDELIDRLDEFSWAQYDIGS